MHFRNLCTALIVSSAGVGLSGCATPAYTGPVEVTRFVAQAPAQVPAMLGRGSISVLPAPGLDAKALEFGLYEDAVAAELTAIGYSVVEQGADQTAQLAYGQVTLREEGRGPVSVGGGAGVGSWGSGGGIGIGINLGGGGSRERIETRLSVSIRDTDAGEVLWEGRSSFAASANSEASDPVVAAQKLASALFGGFPGESGETIEVE